MASFSVVLRKKKRKDGEYPLAIRIIKDRKTSYIYLSMALEEADWDPIKQKVKKSHANSVRLNNLIAQKLAEANDTFLELEAKKEKTTAASMKTKIKQQNQTHGFFALAKEYLQNLKKSGKYNRYSADVPRIKRFKEFVKASEIAFEEITPGLLNRFQAHLRSTRDINERTVVNHLVVIRTLYNQAIYNGMAERNNYPFGRGKIVIRFPETNKIGLTEDEVKELVKLELEVDSHEFHARNLWMFSFYLAGMRVSDVLRMKWENIEDGRVHYTMGKNAKAGSLKLPAKAVEILDFYRTNYKNNHGLIFPHLSKLRDINDNFAVQKRINQMIQVIGSSLKDLGEQAGITKKLSMHIARHTFGNLSGEKIPLQMLQKLYRHTSITTTIDYQKNFMFKDTDDALDAVVNF